MHMREPTVGDFRTDNTHPFRFRRWTFAHQGTVAGFAALRDGLVDGLPDFLRRNLHGETDSEVFFHHVLGGLHRRGVLDSQAPPREAVAAAIMDTVQVLTGLSKAHSDAPSGLTCVLTDGHLTTAVCQGAPLFYVERRGPLPDDPTAPQRSQQTAVLRDVQNELRKLQEQRRVVDELKAALAAPLDDAARHAWRSRIDRSGRGG